MQEYIISAGETRAVILPEKGGTVVSLTRNGVEFLYRDQENLDSPERPRCGIPFLFPMFGRLKDGVYQWNGETYAMEIHGFGHTSPWTVTSHTGEELVMELTDTPETRKQYPFAFRTQLRCRVSEGTLSIRQRFENRGTAPMPYSFGFHPYFLTEMLEALSVETTAAQHFDFAKGAPSAFGHGSVGVSLPEGAPETGSAFFGVTGPTSLHLPGEGRRVTMETHGHYPALVLWTQAGKRFLCVEPINGTANGFNTGVHDTLLPGEAREALLEIHVDLI